MDYIKNEVNKLVEKYNTRDPFELCSALNIPVAKFDLGPDTNGVYCNEDGKKLIGLNISLEPEEQPITCSHEVGHAVLHPEMNCYFIKNHTFFDTNKIEKAANLFAAHLLIPDEALCFTDKTVYELAEELKVPLWLLQLKLESIKEF